MLDSRGSLLGKPGRQVPFMPAARCREVPRTSKEKWRRTIIWSEASLDGGWMPRQTPSRLLEGPIGWWRSLVVCRSWARRGARGDSNRGFCRGSGGRTIDRGNVSVVTMFGVAGCPASESGSSFDWEIWRVSLPVSRRLLESWDSRSQGRSAGGQSQG